VSKEEEVLTVMETLDLHRWKSHNGSSLTCECGVVVLGDKPDEYYHSPLDEAFRRHIAEAIMADLPERT
jgi:hypothetical protein